MKYDADKGRAYFEAAFSKSLGRDQMALKCPFHDDRTESFSLNVRKGTWTCHAGCGSGGVIEFEMRRSGTDHDSARDTVRDVLGMDKALFREQGPPAEIVATYPYQDESGATLFEKIRLQPKSFRQRRMVDGRYVYNLDGIQKPLYRLPELVTANVALIAEGEKDCDSLRDAKMFCTFPEMRVAATTNFDGAGKWNDRYAPYFAGKAVYIFPDNDAIGRDHANTVAESVSKYAARVRIVHLPGLSEKGDVTDFLSEHGAKALELEMQRAPHWSAPERHARGMEEMLHFISRSTPEIDWLVEGVIERGANGIVVAEPKIGKSFILLDLVVACASGTSWLGIRAPRRTRCGIISREDNPAMTRRRLRQLIGGRSIAVDMEGWVYVNTREHTSTFDLGTEEEVSSIVADLKSFGCEFAVFDVFRRLHMEDENDNTVMARVLAQLTRIQQQAGCALGLVHHINKDAGGNIFTRTRGASALHGWTEWGIGITMANAPQKTRKAEFECKSAAAHDPIFFQIADLPSGDVSIVDTSDPTIDISADAPRRARHLN